MAYIARSDVETFLNITLTANGQALVDALIAAIEAYVDRECNRTWTKGSSDNITETFDGGTDTFFLLNTPVASIQSFTVGGTAYDLGNIYNYGSYLKTKSVVGSKPREIVIVYRTSANTIPADLKHAIVRWISEIFKSQDDAGKVASRVTSGPVSVEYLTQDGIPKFVEDVIKHYRLYPI
jgi:hypothetical protein